MVLKGTVTHVKNSMGEFFKKMRGPPKVPRDSGTRAPVPVPAAARDERAYRPLDQESACDEFFLRLKRVVYAAAEARGTSLYRETGKLTTGRPYFYVKPFNEKGWLFERDGAGWRVARAEKIVTQDRFIREPDLEDLARVYVPRDPERLPRVMSQLWGPDLVSVSVYEDRILRQLGLRSPPAKESP